MSSPTQNIFHSLWQKFGLEKLIYRVRLNFGADMTRVLKIEVDTENISNWVLRELKANFCFSKTFPFVGKILTCSFFPADAVRFFRGWLNADAVKYGGKQVSSIIFFTF
jgi:hypothetical protein